MIALAYRRIAAETSIAAENNQSQGVAAVPAPEAAAATAIHQITAENRSQQRSQWLRELSPNLHQYSLYI